MSERLDVDSRENLVPMTPDCAVISLVGTDCSGAVSLQRQFISEDNEITDSAQAGFEVIAVRFMCSGCRVAVERQQQVESTQERTVRALISSLGSFCKQYTLNM